MGTPFCEVVKLGSSEVGRCGGFCTDVACETLVFMCLGITFGSFGAFWHCSVDSFAS